MSRITSPTSRNKRSIFSISLIYLLAATLPLSFLLTGDTVNDDTPYTYRLGQHVLFFEAVILFALPFAFIQLPSGTLRYAVVKLDIWLVILLFFSLFSVIVSWDILYISLREYRHVYFVPFIVYMLCRLFISNQRQLINVLIAFQIPVFFQAGLAIFYYFQTGARLENAAFVLPKVILSVVLSIGLFSTLFLPWLRKSRFRMFMRSMLAISLGLALLLSAGRTAIFTTVLGLFIVYYFLDKKWFKPAFMVATPVLIGSIFFASIMVEPNRIKAEEESTKDERYSVSRVVSKNQLYESINSRLTLWNLVIDEGLESPIYGLGLGFFQTMSIGPAHTHNAYINIFASSGIIGLSIYLYIVMHCFNRTFLAYTYAVDENGKALAKLVFFIGFVLMVAGITNAYEGGLHPILFFYFALVAKVFQFNQKHQNDHNIARKQKRDPNRRTGP